MQYSMRPAEIFSYTNIYVVVVIQSSDMAPSWNALNSTFDSLELRLSFNVSILALAHFWHRVLLGYRKGMIRFILLAIEQLIAVLNAVEDLLIIVLNAVEDLCRD